MLDERRENIIKRIKELSLLLGATCQELGTLNSVGRSSKKIVIEYDIEQSK